MNKRALHAALRHLTLLLACTSCGAGATVVETPAPVVVAAQPAESPPVGDPLDEETIAAPSAPPSMAIGWCLRSRMCELEGMCSASDGGLCIAANDSDCEDSKACLGGRCSARGGLCVAANDEDCRESWACKGYGRCYFDGGQACMATSDDDCKASTRCARLGECRAQGGKCVK